MSKSIGLLALALGLMMPQTGAAKYFRIGMNVNSIDFTKRTHILVSDFGEDLKSAPRNAAAAKAFQIAEVAGGDQVVLIAATGRYPIKPQGWPYQSLALIDATMSNVNLASELAQFSQIASLHFYGHGSIPDSPFLDKVAPRDERFPPFNSGWESLAGHFTDDAFVSFNACNLGQVLAPRLSYLWSIPVSGALTGTHFESNSGNGFEWNGNFTSIRQYRMRPDNARYNSHYGSYSQGLPFYKFFCAGNVSEQRCLATMARSVLMNVSPFPLPMLSSIDQLKAYKERVAEWLCPTENQSFCISRLVNLPQTPAEADMTYTPFRSNSMNCDMQSCYPEKLACISDPKRSAAGNTCAERERHTIQSHAFVMEYLNYLKGYKYLNATL